MNTAVTLNLGASPPPRLPRAAEGTGSRPAPSVPSGQSGVQTAEKPQITEAAGQPAGNEQESLREIVEAAVENTNTRMTTVRYASVRFKIDESTGETMIQVVDRETEEVIRSIPPEEMLRASQNLDLKGLIIDSQG